MGKKYKMFKIHEEIKKLKEGKISFGVLLERLERINLNTIKEIKERYLEEVKSL